MPPPPARPHSRRPRLTATSPSSGDASEKSDFVITKDEAQLAESEKHLASLIDDEQATKEKVDEALKLVKVNDLA